jgi:hypothetical protein
MELVEPRRLLQHHDVATTKGLVLWFRGHLTHDFRNVGTLSHTSPARYLVPSSIVVVAPVDAKPKLPAYFGDPVQCPNDFHSLARALQYMTFTRTDISYVVQQRCLHMRDSRISHLAALKRILKYIQGTLDLGLVLWPS